MAIFVKLSPNAQELMEKAKQLAISLKCNAIGPEHILLALLEDTHPIVKSILPENFTQKNVIKLIETLPAYKKEEIGEGVGLSEQGRQLLEVSALSCKSMRGELIEIPHIWLAIFTTSLGMINVIFKHFGIDASKMHQKLAIAFIFRKTRLDTESPITIMQDENNGMDGFVKSKKAEEKNILELYCRDLTKDAQEGLLDPVIGRDRETMRIFQILTRRTKNNPVLIGEPGVGKSSVVEGLAQLIVSGEVPETMIGKRILSLDVGGMLAGSKYRGDFEERLKETVKAVQEAKNILLFIDEFHTLVGAGKGEGSIDAASLLKPALARGELQCIGATTLDEYRKHIEKDAALERRFQPVQVGEPTTEEAYLILQGLRPRYEEYHNVKITDEALQDAVRLSDRYISDRFLPDKAIDLMDEAAASVRLRTFIPPQDVKEMKVQIEKLKLKKNEAICQQEFEMAAKIRDEQKTLEEEVKRINLAWQAEKEVMSVSVDEDDIAQVVGSWTGVPVKRMTEAESVRLLQLESLLHERVIGQNEAITAVSRALRRARAGLQDPKRPIGSFIFLGPTGVGKTEQL